MPLNAFAPGAYGALTCVYASSRAALPAGTTLLIWNVGPQSAIVKLGDPGVAVTSAGDGVAVPVGKSIALTVGAASHIAGIAVGLGGQSVANLNLCGGT